MVKKKAEQGSAAEAAGDGWAAAAEVSATSTEEAKRDAEARDFPPVDFEEPLGVRLTDDEAAERGRELERCLTEIEDVEEERKDLIGRLKAKIELLSERKSELRKVVRLGEEVRPVKCRRSFLIEQNTVREVRLDTGEVVRERAMTAQERQPRLPGMPDDPPVAEDLDDGDEVTDEGDEGDLHDEHELDAPFDEDVG